MLRNLRYRTRLTVIYTTVFALALFVFGQVAYAAVRWSLAASTAARLQTTAKALRGIPDVKRGRTVMDADDRRQFAALLTGDRLDGAALRMDGSVLYANTRPPAAALATVMRGRASTSGMGSGAGFAYAWQPVTSKTGARAGSVVVWISSAADDDVARITLVALFIAGLTTLALAALIGTFAVQRTLQPLTELNALMSAIEAADLSERLEWTGPDDELGRLCSTFDRLLDRLQVAFEHERRFTADASHELRTPLSVMRAEIEFSLARDEADYRATLQRLQTETLRLETLIESLLATARSEAGLGIRSPQPLHEIAARAAERMQPIATAQEITLSVAIESTLWARVDPAFLESVLAALLDNAVRHAPTAGSVRISLHAGGDAAVLRVSDDGPGFTAAALRNGTQRFWRDDPSRSSKGTGLGLAIVASFAERHGGSLTLRNDGGAVVELTIPAYTVAVRSSTLNSTA